MGKEGLREQVLVLRGVAYDRVIRAREIERLEMNPETGLLRVWYQGGYCECEVADVERACRELTVGLCLGGVMVVEVKGWK